MRALSVSILIVTLVGCADLDTGELPTESTSSALTTCSTLTAPVPYGPSGNIGDPTPLYSWSAVPGATNYTIYVLDPNENWLDFALGTTNTWHQGQDLSDYANVQLRWKVKAECYDESGYHPGPYSGSVYFKYYLNEDPPGGNDGSCYPSLKACLAECTGVCERRINCGGATAHKCFE